MAAAELFFPIRFFFPTLSSFSYSSSAKRYKKPASAPSAFPFSTAPRRHQHLRLERARVLHTHNNTPRHPSVVVVNKPHSLCRRKRKKKRKATTMADAAAMAKANEPVPDMVKQFVVYFYRHIREKNGACRTLRCIATDAEGGAGGLRTQHKPTAPVQSGGGALSPKHIDPPTPHFFNFQSIVFRHQSNSRRKRHK